jgi:hypothetical protein
MLTARLLPRRSAATAEASDTFLMGRCTSLFTPFWRGVGDPSSSAMFDIVEGLVWCCDAQLKKTGGNPLRRRAAEVQNYIQPPFGNLTAGDGSTQ